MSDVKYQLRTLLPSLSQTARSVTDAEVKRRFYVLKRVAESPKSVQAVCRFEGHSVAWFYKWAGRLISKKCLSGLSSRSRVPRRQPALTKNRIVKKIRQLREQAPYSGKEVISQDLNDLFSIDCRPSTVGHVLRREKLIKTKKQRKTKRHDKRYRRPVPGYLQMDFKYVPYLILDRQYYQLSAVDHHSSWRLIRMYPRKNVAAVMDFLNELAARFPGAIIELQTDNDAAFTDKFNSGHGVTGEHAVDKWCAGQGILHRLIPPSVKELNGKVENTHRQDEREFYQAMTVTSFEHLKLSAEWYNERWNKRRKTKALGWLTPEETLERALVTQLAWLGIMQKRYSSLTQLPLRMNAHGVISLAIPITPPAKTKPLPTKTSTPRKTALRRYLDYLDWDEQARKKR